MKRLKKGDMPYTIKMHSTTIVINIPPFDPPLNPNIYHEPTLINFEIDFVNCGLLQPILLLSWVSKVSLITIKRFWLEMV
jgi:hypothetical protein